MTKKKKKMNEEKWSITVSEMDYGKNGPPATQG
jgi:hypothetical protein